MLVLNNDHWIQLVKKNTSIHIYFNYLPTGMIIGELGWSLWIFLKIQQVVNGHNKYWFCGREMIVFLDAYQMEANQMGQVIAVLSWTHSIHSRWTRALFVQKSVEISQERSRMVTWGWHYENLKYSLIQIESGKSMSLICVD